MPTTLVHGFAPMACTLLSRRWLPRLEGKQIRRLALLAFILGNAPDWDLVPAALFPRYWDSLHRELGHNVFSMLALAGVGVWLARRWVGPTLSRRTAWGLCTALVFSHGLLDAFGDEQSSGVPLFWPLSDHAYRIPLRLFPRIDLDPELNPLVAMVTSPDYWAHVLYYEISFIALVTAGWALAVRLAARRAGHQAPLNEELQTF